MGILKLFLVEGDYLNGMGQLYSLHATCHPVTKRVYQGSAIPI